MCSAHTQYNRNLILCRSQSGGLVAKQAQPDGVVFLSALLLYPIEAQNSAHCARFIHSLEYRILAVIPVVFLSIFFFYSFMFP